MTGSDITALIQLVEEEVGASDWTSGSHGLCWPRFIELVTLFFGRIATVL